MDARELLKELQQKGFSLRPLPGEKLEIHPASKLNDALRQVIKAQKPELLKLLYRERWFLSRPLAEEANPDPWQAWEGFMVWLLEHHPEHYHLVCDAEDRLSASERQGITTGVEYEEACTELRHRFETARKLKISAELKVWLQ